MWAKVKRLKREVARLNHQIKTQRYGLNWLNCPEAFEVASKDKIPVLEEIAEKAVKHDNEKPTHILIEDDNFHVLTCLNYMHRENAEKLQNRA